MKTFLITVGLLLTHGLYSQTIGAGYYNNLSICADGSLMSWGHNGGYELGTGAPITNSNT